MGMHIENQPWNVEVYKHGSTYMTEFKVGHQGFALCRVEVDKNTSDEEARHHAIFTQVMFLNALANLGIVKPGGVPDLKTALKQKVGPSWRTVGPASPPSSKKSRSPKGAAPRRGPARK